jgi:hypothetical protein
VGGIFVSAEIIPFIPRPLRRNLPVNFPSASRSAIQPDVRAIATILTSFGIEDEDRRELRADFQHLRRWRKSVEQAQSYTFKAVITVIVTGLVGAIWLGIKVMLGK